MPKLLTGHWHEITAGIGTAAIFALPIGITQLNRRWIEHGAWMWVTAFLLILAVFVLVSRKRTGLWLRGIFLDDSNRPSLAQVQSGLWMFLLLSTLVVVVPLNVLAGSQEAWKIDLPNELLIAAGISLATLVSARVVDANANTEALRGDIDANRWGANPENPNRNVRNMITFDNEWTNIGTRAVRTDKKQSSWFDLFVGTAAGKEERLDVTRIQMFVLTLVLVSVYAGQVLENIQKVAPEGAEGAMTPFVYPTMSSELLGLLGISSVGYVGGKMLELYDAKQK